MAPESIPPARMNRCAAQRELERRIRETPQALKEEIEELRQQKIHMLQDRLAIRLLEITETGRLIYRDVIHPEGVPLLTETDAQNLIDDDRLRLGAAKWDFVFPDSLSPFADEPVSDGRILRSTNAGSRTWPTATTSRARNWPREASDDDSGTAAAG